MNYTETFDQFASGLGPTDLALYAGVGIVLWILFKDRLSPVQKFLVGLLPNKTNTVNTNDKTITTDNILTNIFDRNPPVKRLEQEDNFYNLVVSWKQTRDLALKCGCTKAVEVADQMFPFLSPSVCRKESGNE